MRKRTFHLENHAATYAASLLTEQNFGLHNEVTWPLVWYGHNDPEHHYYIRAGWKILGTCKAPIPSRCDGHHKAFVAQNEKGEMYWWHFIPKTILINPNSQN